MSSVPAKAAARFAETEVDDETVLMNLNTGQFFALKETGRSIWAMIDGTRDVAEISAALAGDYALPDDAEGEVRAFVEALSDAGFVV